MAALTAERTNTRKIGTGARPERISFRVAAATKIYKGALVVLTAAGYAAPGSVATTHTAVGRAVETVDNTGGAAGALRVEVEQGVFTFNNSSAGDLIAVTDVSKTCYIVDDNTVALTNGTSTRSAAGKIIDITSDGQVAVLVAF
jgi:hypothetical protein